MRFSALFALPISLCASFAAAAPATPEGAAALTTTLQTYLGATEGVVNVTPSGETYAVKLDFAPLVPKDSGASATATPIEFSLADNGDGTWAMTQDQALSLAVNVPGKADIAIKIGQFSSTGTFDTALATFSTTTTNFSGVTVTEKLTAPTGETNVAYTIDSGTYESTATAGAAGGVDSKSTYSMQGIAEIGSIPSVGEGAPPVNLSLKAESNTGDATVTGMRPDAIYKLVAFLVANPDEAAIAAQQDGLKTIIKDGLPLFDHALATGKMNAVSIDTPIGTIGLTDLAAEVEANGIVDNGLFREAFTLNGLTLPAGVVPDWAAQLVPSSVSVDFKAASFNLAAPAALLLQTLDLANPQPNTPEQDQALLAALLPTGVVDITLAPGSVTAPIYGLTYEGTMAVGPNSPMPAAKAKITATGITAVKQALAAAPPEFGGQIGPMLGMAEAMAKPGDNGALVWELESTPEGSFTVNGTNLMGGQ